MTGPPTLRIASLAWACGLAATTAACGVTSKSLAVSASLTGMAQISGHADPNHGCTPPTPPAPTPAARWNAEPPSNKVLAPAGFEVWRNGADGGACLEHREVAYRAIIQYDLIQVIPIKDTITKVEMTFSSKVLPSGVTPSASNLCDPTAGGLGSLFEVTPPAVPMTSNLQELTPTFDPNGTVSPAPFPGGTKVVAFPVPWLPGPIGTNASTAPSGLGGASFTVDVTARVKNAMAAGRPVIQFMLSSSDETFPRAVPPPSSIDCRTLFEIGNLQVTYLGN